MKSLIRSLVLSIAIPLMLLASCAEHVERPIPLQTVVVTGSRASAIGETSNDLLEPVPTTESFTVGSRGVTLWGIYGALKLPRKDWPKFWEETSRLSNVPHTDAAWRKIPVGKKLTMPRDPNAIALDKKLRAEALHALMEERQNLLAENASLKTALAEARDSAQRGLFASYMFMILLVLGLLVYFSRRSSNQKLVEQKAAGDVTAFSLAPSDHVVPSVVAQSPSGPCGASCASCDVAPCSDKPNTPAAAPSILGVVPADTRESAWSGFPTSPRNDAASDEFPGSMPWPLPLAVETPMVRNAHADDAVAREFLVCEVDTEHPTNGHARDVESGLLYVFNETTEGFTHPPQVNKSYRGMVAANGIVTKVLHETPGERQQDGGGG